MDDLPLMEVGQAAENLPGEIGKGALVGDMRALQRPFVHILKEHLNFTIVIDKVVASNNVRVIDTAKYLDFTAHLIPYGILVVPVDYFKRVDFTRGTVKDFVDRATGAAADAVNALQLRVIQLKGRRGGGRSGARRQRKWNGEGGVAVGEW